ncbi:GNAT family N-acetyltransferase [Melghiribacillus thermohalophilus]|nr:GNAT family N-acetyltransferase [Melghiribacillus thermohalophilus]
MIQERKNLLILAYVQQSLVAGYKIGYETKKERFYSWLGGVHPNHRNKGIGSALMAYQHEYCRSEGYQTIETRTKNKWKGMLILNLKHGFDVIGTYTDEKGDPKIILRKNLLRKNSMLQYDINILFPPCLCYNR